MPDWYAIDQAAKRYHKGPWELLTAPAFWVEKALIATYAEASAARPKEQHITQ